MSVKDMPQHVTFIMDGNGRWAKSRGMERFAGHHEGAQTFKATVYACADRGIKYCSFYAFSKENWTRPEQEVDVIMGLWKIYIEGEVEKLQRYNVRVRVLGDRADLPKDLQDQILVTEKATEHCTGTQALIFLSYSARWELLEATKQIARKVAAGELEADAIDESVMDNHLTTAGFPEPDLMIRTSGEQRISNYMLWQLSYSEFVFVDKAWPDFNEEELDEALDQYMGRDRRFGGVGEDIGFDAS